VRLGFVAWQELRNDLSQPDRMSSPGVVARGVMQEDAGKLTVAVVGGTGVYKGATGVIEGSRLPSGVTLDVARLQVP
jgi:hypothetical protein